MYQDIVLDGIPGPSHPFKNAGVYCVLVLCLGMWSKMLPSPHHFALTSFLWGGQTTVSDSLRLLGTEHELFSAESAGRSQGSYSQREPK